RRTHPLAAVDDVEPDRLGAGGRNSELLCDAAARRRAPAEGAEGAGDAAGHGRDRPRRVHPRARARPAAVLGDGVKTLLGTALAFAIAGTSQARTIDVADYFVLGPHNAWQYTN